MIYLTFAKEKSPETIAMDNDHAYFKHLIRIQKTARRLTTQEVEWCVAHIISMTRPDCRPQYNYVYVRQSKWPKSNRRQKSFCLRDDTPRQKSICQRCFEAECASWLRRSKYQPTPYPQSPQPQEWTPNLLRNRRKTLP